MGGGGGTFDYSVTPGPSFWEYHSDSELCVFPMTLPEPDLKWDLCGSHVWPVWDPCGPCVGLEAWVDLELDKNSYVRCMSFLKQMKINWSEFKIINNQNTYCEIKRSSAVFHTCLQMSWHLYPDTSHCLVNKREAQHKAREQTQFC